MSQFSADISKWAVKAEEEFEQLRRAVIIELFSSVILDTPVDEGRLRGNWQISNGGPKSGTVEVTDPKGTATIRKVQDFVSKLPKGQDVAVFLANNLPYAYTVEYGGYSGPSPSGKVLSSGFLRKAPEGMVRKNFIRVSQNLKRGLV